MTKIKICGVTSTEDAEMCLRAGADALGLNFWSGSPRRCDADTARDIAALAKGRACVVGVFVDAPTEEIRAVHDHVKFDAAQLHGAEDAHFIRVLGIPSIKALQAGGPGVLDALRFFEGPLFENSVVLLDAAVAGMVGGTGQMADWKVAGRVAKARRVLLAGGIRPENVAAAVTQVRPWGVDVASGVESAPGKKDPDKVAALVSAVRELHLSPRPEAG